MRKIKINKWKAKLPTGEDADEDLRMAINTLLVIKRPEEIPRGIDKFRMFIKIADAFEKADESEILELQEREYQFLKSVIETEIPSTWGMNKNLVQAIDDFLNAREE